MLRFDLKAYRLSKGVKQNEFARLLSLPQSCVSEMENEKSTVAPHYITTLRKHYNDSEEELHKYYKEVETGNCHHNRGNNSGQNNHYQVGIDPNTIKSITGIEKDVKDILEYFKGKIEKYENDIKNLREEKEDLSNKITSFRILCAKNNLDCSCIVPDPFLK